MSEKNRDTSVCSQRAAQILRRLIAEKQEGILVEWLNLAARAGQRPPDDLAPLLLDIGNERPALRERILPVLGEHGFRLAKQSEKWNYIAGQVYDENDWATGSKTARMVWLKQCRRDNPDKARKALRSLWSRKASSDFQDSARTRYYSTRDRAEFLAVFDVALGKNDEAFFVECLDDPDKTIRRIAANLLARLADSDFTQRLRDRARFCLTVKKEYLKKTLCVSLPGIYSNEMKRIGVEESDRSEEMLEKRSSWFLQILFRVAPSFWRETLGAAPAELLELASETDYETVLGWGWSMATLLHRDAEWAEVLIKNAGKQWLKLATQRPCAFLDVLSRERREAVILSKLDAAKRNPTRLANVFQLLKNSNRWTPNISKAILSRLALLAPTLERTRHLNYNLLSLFNQAALNAGSETLRQLQEQLLPVAGDNLPISDGVKAIMEVVEIRQEIHKEFAS